MQADLSGPSGYACGVTGTGADYGSLGAGLKAMAGGGGGSMREMQEPPPTLFVEARAAGEPVVLGLTVQGGRGTLSVTGEPSPSRPPYPRPGKASPPR